MEAREMTGRNFIRHKNTSLFYNASTMLETMNENNKLN
jgi:hypothetical protein